MQKLKHYEAPKLSVVSFKVEDGFQSRGILQNGANDNGIIFGGSRETGGIDESGNNHTGLPQYGFDNDLFGTSSSN